MPGLARQVANPRGQVRPVTGRQTSHSLRLVNRDSNATAFTFVIHGTASDENPADHIDENVMVLGDYAVISGFVKGSPGERNYTFTGAVIDVYLGQGDTIIELDGQQVAPSDVISMTGGGEAPPPSDVSVTTECLIQVEEARAAAADQQTQPNQTLMNCPSGDVTYMARNDVERDFLLDAGWQVVEGGGGGGGGVDLRTAGMVAGVVIVGTVAVTQLRG